MTSQVTLRQRSLRTLSARRLGRRTLAAAALCVGAAALTLAAVPGYAQQARAPINGVVPTTPVPPPPPAAAPGAQGPDYGDAADQNAALGLYLQRSFDVIDANHKNDLAACTAAAKTFLDACPKVGAGEKNGCDGAQYAAECIARNGGDCALARPTYELYVTRTYATSTPESRAATVARFKCSAPGAAPDTAKPPPNKRKGGKKKP